MKTSLIAIYAVALQMPLLAAPISSTASTVMKIEVDRGVQLEVLDLGGSGPPIVFLAGLGSTAHSFDGFAQRFTSRHHVHAISRRGFGNSDRPPTLEINYSPERLAADVVSVINTLGIKKAIIVGHSIAGEELSELALSFPSRIAGLIYLDAANSYAFYGENSTDLYPLAGQVKRDLSQLIGAQPSEIRTIIARLQSEIPRLQPGINRLLRRADGIADRPDEDNIAPVIAVQNAILRSEKTYRALHVPVLSILASPPKCDSNCNTMEWKQFAADIETQAHDFASANANAVIVRVPYADYYMWETNGEDLFRSMNTFMDNLDY